MILVNHSLYELYLLHSSILKWSKLRKFDMNCLSFAPVLLPQQFNLVCQKEVIVYTANSILFLGWTVGGFVLPYLSDRFGRKTVLFPAAFVIIICGFLSSFVHDMWIFILLRLIIGFCQAGSVNIFVIATEIVGPYYRSISGTFIWFYFTCALLLMTLKAYYLQNWRNLEIICSLPFAVIMLSWRYVPESVRWLRMKGRLDEAMQVLKEIARANKRDISNMEIIPVENNFNSKSTIADLFRSPVLALYTAIQIFAWLVSGITFYGVSLASSDLGGDLYVDFILTSIVEIPANILVIIFTNKCGRRLTTVINIFLAGFACIGVAAVPSGVISKGLKFAKVGLGMLGKFAVTLYFNAFYVWSAELNATVVRAQAVGILIAASRVGAAMSPFVMTGLKYVNASLPFALIGILNLLAGCFCLYLRETKGIEVPDTIEDCLKLLHQGGKNPSGENKSVSIDSMPCLDLKSRLGSH
ncbi:solute carrier family 22 member 3-like isoform X2 [Rhopilema esculentum]|uniref:solute carrier family 22 member 3-like isoform X2 n=1 Tax=Rhopilema esculentum TaxID=499914 RepID=UPI0031E2C27B